MAKQFPQGHTAVNERPGRPILNRVLLTTRQCCLLQLNFKERESYLHGQVLKTPGPPGKQSWAKSTWETQEESPHLSNENCISICKVSRKEWG